jgi:tetraacyldisaccharide 4'-kinase
LRFVKRIWEGDEAADRLARAVLFPFETLYRGVVAVRSELYDRALVHIQASSIPVVSVGNLTVGGTGKTPFASWVAQRFRALGMNPAIVLRGYGADEVLVHRRLNPGMQVIADVSRSSGIATAAANGATVAILDDAFQHRQAMRDADIVLLSADSWTGRPRLLPAGPWREPISAVRRASLAVITRKAASDSSVADLATALDIAAPQVPRAVVELRMTGLTRVAQPDVSMKLESLRGKKILAVSAVGNPHAFTDQLRALGAEPIACSYPDHYAFSHSDVAAIIAKSGVSDLIVCTLKDAVKLASRWPAGGPPLWYVSQTVSVESGAAQIDRLLDRIQSHKSSQPT